MQLLSLRLRNFRNYSNAYFTFSPSTNIIAGKNAQGKTNLLEALHLISTGRSFKTSSLRDLIKYNTTFFYLEATVSSNEINQEIKIYYDGEKKILHHNGSTTNMFTPLLGIMPSVIQLPSDLSLITGAPAVRRKFLNIHLSQQDPLYVFHLSRFYRALKQRNQILKSHYPEALESFEEEMARSAVYLTQKRKLLIKELSQHLNAYLQKLTLTKEVIHCDYISHLLEQDDVLSGYLKKLKASRKKDLLLGSTQIGPHRDDFSIQINQQAAKSFASEGRKRTFISALHLAEYSLLLEKTGSSPVFCIDDIEVHLDTDRKNLFQETLSDLGQVFITTPKTEAVEKMPIGSSVFTIEKGEIISVKKADPNKLQPMESPLFLS